MPVFLKVTQSSVTTDTNGLASVVPSHSGFSGPLEVDVAVTAGTGAALDFPQQLVVPPTSTNTPPPPVTRLPLRVREPLNIR
jgi:hypothetical protein